MLTHVTYIRQAWALVPESRWPPLIHTSVVSVCILKKPKTVYLLRDVFGPKHQDVDKVNSSVMSDIFFFTTLTGHA